jgi:putative membrane protein
MLAIAASFTLLSCTDSKRGSDAGFTEGGEEAADVAKTEKHNAKKQRDADFVFETVANQYGEIKLAELAIQRSHSPDVKRLAERLQKDHSASLNELKTLAQTKSISVPVEETEEGKRKLERFADESGVEFDKNWCSEMVRMHEESIDKFEKRSEDTEDADLKTYLRKTVPVLKEHDESLKVCNEKMKDKKG